MRKFKQPAYLLLNHCLFEIGGGGVVVGVVVVGVVVVGSDGVVVLSRE